MSFDEYIGQRFGEYRIDQLIGEGAIGAVFLARHEILDQPFAIKFLRKEFGRQEIVQERFFREARKAAAVRHENIVSVVNAGRHDESIYLVMEFIDGRTLRDLAHDHGGRIDSAEVADLISQTLHGLAAAHDKGIIHRDIKPDNLLVTAEGRVKITDFGLARGADDDEKGKKRLTNAGQILGTPAYMSPEQWDGLKVDARCDLYSVGITMYQLLSGCLPFPGNSPLAIAKKMLTEEAPALAQLVPGIDAGIVAITLKLMARNRDERFATAQKAIAALEKWRRGRLVVRKRSAVGSVGPTTATATAIPLPQAEVETHDFHLEIDTADEMAFDAEPAAQAIPMTTDDPFAAAAPAATAIPMPISPPPQRPSRRRAPSMVRGTPSPPPPPPPPPPPAGGKGEVTVLSAEDMELLRKIENMPEPPDVSPWVGHSIGAYRLTGKIEGRVATSVFTAVTGNSRETVAVKLLPPEPTDTPQQAQTLVQRAEKTLKLRHPHAVRTLAAGTDRGYFYIAMEFAPGISLKDYMKDHGPLPVDQATRWISNLLHALAAAHRVGVYHGNIKPTNVIIDPQNIVRLTEFGLPRRQSAENLQLIGTPMYMAVEQWRGFLPGPAADLYSLGVTWYQMLVGRTPFLGRTAAQLAQARLTDDFFPPLSMRPDIPHPINDLILKLMAREPAWRPQSAEAILAEISAR